MFVGLSHKYKYKSNAKNKSVVVHSFWHWRRVISLFVLITFSNSILSPVFALNQLMPSVVANQINVERGAINANVKTKKTKLHDLRLSSPLVSIKPRFSEAQNKFFLTKNKYQPYFEMGGVKHFNQVSKAAGIFDLFIPLLQSDGRLLFADFRIFDRSGSASEGNLHLGFRKLFPDTRQMFGIYVAFDRKRSDKGNSFNQLTAGFEYWNNRWFVGGNIYKPIGTTSKFLGESQAQKLTITGKNIAEIKTTTNTYYDEALFGVDAELGYAITDKLTSYIGGYYFSAKGSDPIVGPKIRLTYDYQKTTGRILGVLDGISIEAGAQHDTQRRNSAYVGIKFKMGLTNLKKNSNVSGFERHMVELVRRDPDIVTVQTMVERIESKKIELASNDSQKPESLSSMLVGGLGERESLRELLKEFGLSENATLEDVKKLHRQYSLLYHPDKKGGNQKLFIYYQELFEKIEKLFGNSNTVPLPQAQAQNSSYTQTPQDYFSEDTKVGDTKINDTKPKEDFSGVIIKTFSEDNVSTEASNRSNIIDQPIKTDLYNIQQLEGINISPSIVCESQGWAKTLIITPFKWLDYTVNQVFDMLIPLKGAMAEDIIFSVIPDSTNPDVVIKQYAEKQNNKIEDLLDTLSALDINSVELSENSVNYLKQIIKEGSDDIRVLKSIAWVLTNHVTHYAKDSALWVFLINLVKDADVTPVIKETIINKFTKDVGAIKPWHDNKVFDNFASLLPYDDSHHLADALIKAHKNHGYIVSYEALPYFEKLLDDVVAKEDVSVMIANSLEKLLISGSDSDFIKIQKHLDDFLSKTDDLPSGLANAVFEVYRNGQGCFTSSVVNLLAENKYLSSDSLQRLVCLLMQIKDPKVSLFIALRLLQNHVVLPTETLGYFIKFLSDEDKSIRILAINLYYQLNKKIPAEIRTELGCALIVELPYVGTYLRSNINDLLNGFKLGQEQESRRKIQQQVIDQNNVNNPQKKIDINMQLSAINQRFQLSTSDQDELARSVERLINKVEWPADFLFNLINKTFENDASDVSLLVAALEKLNDYTINPEIIDREGLTAFTILEKKPPAEMLPAIKRLIKDNSFFVESDVASFLETLRELNQDNPETLKLIDNHYFAEQLSRIKSIMRDWSAEWTPADYSAWLKIFMDAGGTVNDDNIAEVIAVISQAAHDTVLKGKYYPRQIQQLEVLSLYKSLKGMFSQIDAGEGKSMVIGMYALINAIQGRQVDIVTSSDVLAKRDTLKHQAFYNLFGINASHNTDGRKDGEANDCYLSPIVYGDILNFNGDALSDTSANVRYGRAFDIIIVDEEDDPLVDRYNMKVQLSKGIPTFDVLSYLLVYMWGTATNLIPMLQQKADGCHLTMSVSTKKEEAELKKLILPETKDNETNQFDLIVDPSCVDYFKNEIANFTTEKLFAFNHIPENRLFVVPHNWEKFATDQLSNWVQALLLSFQYTKGVDYILARKTAEDFLQVTLVDKEGGLIEHDLHLSDGLHQFIELENKLVMLPENMVSIFMSYPGFFKQYPEICGLTATLGDKACRDFYGKVYGTALSVNPPHVPKSLTKSPPIYVNDKTELPTILNIIRRKIKGRRAALIVMDTINQVKNAYEYLSNLLGDSSLHMFTYGIGDEESDAKIVAEELRPGDVIIATHLAGRGTDLKLSLEVINEGGLCVIPTTLSANERADKQIEARGARNGEPGSVQQVINLERIKKQFNIDCNGISDDACLDKAYETRDKNNKRELKQHLESDLPYFEIQDDLYASYIKFANELDTPTGYQISIGEPKNPGELKLSTLYLYQEDEKIKLKVANGSDVDITELIKSIDPRAARHIKAGSVLNKQDREIIYFIANKNGYPKNSGIYDRVQNEFNKEVKKKKNQQIYLKWLLVNDDQFRDLQVDREPLPKVELRKLFLLWLVDRKLYNKEYQIRQLAEKFGIWLRKQQCLYRTDNQIDIKAEQRKEEIRNCKEQSSNNFLEFKNLMLAQMADNKFIENPAYLVLDAFRKLQIYYSQRHNSSGDGRTLLEGALAALKEVEELEPTYSWTADNAMANILLVKDGGIYTYEEDDENGNLKKAYELKSKYCEHESNAIKKIHKLIGTINAVLTFLLAQEKIAFTDDLAIQLLGGVAFYKAIATKLQKNIDVVTKTSATDMVRQKDLLDSEKLKQGVSIKEMVLQSIDEFGGMSPAGRDSLNHIIETFDFAREQRPIINQISDRVLAEGGFIIELEAYKLEKEPEKWIGPVIAGLVGLVFMCVGVFLAPYGGIFLQSFAISLISKGVGDIIQSLIAIGRGKPFDLGDYINSSAMSIGISLAAVSFLFIIDKIVSGLSALNGIGKLARDLAKNSWQFIGEVAAIQTATVALSVVLSKLGQSLVDEKDIKAEAEEAIKVFINSYRDTLKSIFATDAFNGNGDLKNLLYGLVRKVMNKYQSWLHDDATTFGAGVGANVAGNFAGDLWGVGNLIQIGAKVVMGSIKNSKALGEIIAGIKKATQEVAETTLKNKAMMMKILEKSFGKNIANDLVGALSSQGYIFENTEIVDCDSLNNVQLGEKLSGYKSGIVEACVSIKKLLLEEYQSSYDSFKNDIVGRITEIITSIQEQEIMQPVADTASASAGTRIGGGLYKYLSKKFSTIEESVDYNKYMKKSPYETIAEDAKSSWFMQNYEAYHENLQQFEPKTYQENPQQPKSEELGTTELANKPITSDSEMPKEFKEFAGYFKGSAVKKSVNNWFMQNDAKSGVATTSNIFDGFFKDGQNLVDRYNGCFYQENSQQAKEVLRNNQIGGQRKPTIELVVREVIPGTGRMHGFSIFTYSNGQKIIFAGYPEEHNPLRNLQIVDELYVVANKKLLGDDWVDVGYENSKKHKIIMTKTFDNDQELNGYLSRAREAVKFMETGNKGERFDYDICFTAKCWGENSNTVQRVIYDAMGIEIKPDNGAPMPNMPGIKGRFYEGSTDSLHIKTYKKAQEINQKSKEFVKKLLEEIPEK